MKKLKVVTRLTRPEKLTALIQAKKLNLSLSAFIAKCINNNNIKK